MTAVLFFVGCQMDSEDDDPVVDAVKPVITTQPVGGTYEKGATDAADLTVQATVTDGGAVRYQWYMSTAENAPGTPVTFQGPQTSYTPSTDTLGTRWYYVEVTNTKDKQIATVTSNKVSIGITSRRVAFMPINNAGYGIDVISQVPDPNNWTLNATGQAEIYFGVVKTATQTVGVSGTDAAKVRMVNSNDTIDGDPVKINNVNVGNDPGYAVFKVDTGTFNLMFRGGGETMEFTLDVREGDVQVQQVPVTLNVTAPLIPPESITIFSVTRTASQIGDEAGSLRKIDAVVEGHPVTGLLDALKWIDQNTADNHPEYLVRVEKDEVIPRVVLTCLDKAVTIRLRGYQKDQKITYDSVNEDGYNSVYNNPTVFPTYNTSLITLGYGYGSTASKEITLQLEEHIILNGDGTIPNNWAYYMVLVQEGRTFIMKSGSKITGYNNENGISGCNMIEVMVDNNSPPVNVGKFILDGGTITGNIVYEGVICTSGLAEHNLATFTYKSGEVYGNTTYKGEDGNYRTYTYYDIENDINIPELLPPITSN
jgi:hypothetical protein